MASWTTHSSPSFRFVPVIALHGRIVHLCVLIESKSRRWKNQSSPQPGNRNHRSRHTCRTSCSLMQCSTSVLFKKTKRVAPINRCEVSWRRDLRVGSHLFQQQPSELLSAIIDTEAICSIHHPDEGVGLLEIVFPVRPQGFLPANVPCDCQ